MIFSNSAMVGRFDSTIVYFAFDFVTTNLRSRLCLRKKTCYSKSQTIQGAMRLLLYLVPIYKIAKNVLKSVTDIRLFFTRLREA